MAAEFGEGRYVAYGFGPGGPRVGWVEDGFVRSDNGTWLFRIDGDEVYSPTGALAGFISEDGVASQKNGQFMFRLEKD